MGDSRSAVETDAERLARWEAAGYGSSGGSALDRLEALRAKVNGIDAGERARCYCGHYASEHTPECGGAYGTLQADADDFESVEVRCGCIEFSAAPANWHEVRA